MSVVRFIDEILALHKLRTNFSFPGLRLRCAMMEKGPYWAAEFFFNRVTSLNLFKPLGCLPASDILRFISTSDYLAKIYTVLAVGKALFVTCLRAIRYFA